MTHLCSPDLLALLRVTLGTSSPADLPPQPGSDALLAEARKFGLAALLLHHPGATLYTDDFRQALKRSTIAAAAHYTRLAKSLTTLCSELQRRGIDAVPFKGIALSQRLFGDIIFRPCTDLDFLVKKQHAQAAVQSLLDLGFQLSTDLPCEAVTATLQHFYSLEFRHPDTHVLVDLQWDIANGYVPSPWPEEALFRRTTSLSILDQPVPFFADPITLYLLCVHGAKNSWCELRALLDLAVMMKSFAEPVWTETLQVMQEQGSATMLTTGVLLANRLFGVPLPPAAAAQTGRRPQRLASAIQKHWQVKGQERPSAWQRLLWDVRFREGGRECRRYLLFRLQPTRTDQVHKRLPAPLVYLKRFARIFRTART